MASINKTRILFKTDTTENWQAQENTFQTLKGELYFYKDAIDTGKINHAGNKTYKQQLKIGNGTDKISGLAFFQNPYISNSEIDELFNINLLDTARLDFLVLG